MEEGCASLIKNALDSDIGDIIRLAEYKELIDTLRKSRATESVAIASLVAKIQHPDWDTRLHEVQNGAKFSLRTWSGKVNKELYLRDLLKKRTDYACLSPAFKGVKAPFDENFTGSINPKESLPALLHFLKVINTTASPDLLHDMLKYMISQLKKEKEANDSLKNSVVVCSNDVSISDMLVTLDKLYKLGSGSSVIPVLVVHTLLCVVQPYLWPGVYIKPLKEHTAPDRHGEPGDIEGLFSNNSEYAIACEIKHNQIINDTFIKEFHSKVADKNIPLKYILTTAKATLTYTKDSVCIDTVNGFVSTHLYNTLFHKKDICTIFLQKLRTQIVDYRNIDITIKENSNNILTSLLS
jgi:hypothetical protein